MTYLSHLECSECGQTYSAHELHNLCVKCGAPLWVRYDLALARQELDRDRLLHVRQLWALARAASDRRSGPTDRSGEGGTPLLRIDR